MVAGPPPPPLAFRPGRGGPPGAPAGGGTVYRARFSQGGTNTASPVAANGVIYQGTEEGTLYVFAAGPEYRELAVHDFGAPLMATPAISEGILLFRTRGHLLALSEREARAD